MIMQISPIIPSSSEKKIKSMTLMNMLWTFTGVHLHLMNKEEWYSQPFCSLLYFFKRIYPPPVYFCWSIYYWASEHLFWLFCLLMNDTDVHQGPAALLDFVGQWTPISSNKKGLNLVVQIELFIKLNSLMFSM